MHTPLLLLASLLLTGCPSGSVRDIATTADTNQLTPEERRMWAGAGRLDEQIARQNILYRDAELTAYVQQLTERLYPELKGAVRVGLIDSPDLNAFALPNGSVYFNIGLLARLDNEAQLATILAHEVSHFARQHALKQRRSADSVLTAGMAISVLTGIPLSGELFAVTAISGYSRELETEADQLGFERLVANSYDPSQARQTFEHLLKEVETLDIDQPFFFSSHPQLQERIRNFEELTASSRAFGSVQNRDEFLARTVQARADILDRYLALHRYQTLILMLEQADNRDRYPTHAAYYLGEAYRQRAEQGDATRAEAAYVQAIESAPEFAPSYRALGILLMKAGKNEPARQHLTTYLALEPQARDRAYIEQYIQSLEQP